MSEESRAQSLGKGVMIGATVVSMVVLTFLGVDMIKSQSTPKAASMVRENHCLPDNFNSLFFLIDFLLCIYLCPSLDCHKFEVF